MKKGLFSIALVFLVMICSSCSSKPPATITETIYQRQYIPLNMLEISCVESSPGDTVRTLAVSWANNTSCLRAYQSLVKGIIENYTKEGVMNGTGGQ